MYIASIYTLLYIRCIYQVTLLLDIRACIYCLYYILYQLISRYVYLRYNNCSSLIFLSQYTYSSDIQYIIFSYHLIYKQNIDFTRSLSSSLDFEHLVCCLQTFSSYATKSVLSRTLVLIQQYYQLDLVSCIELHQDVNTACKVTLELAKKLNTISLRNRLVGILPFVTGTSMLIAFSFLGFHILDPGSRLSTGLMDF